MLATLVFLTVFPLLAMNGTCADPAITMAGLQSTQTNGDLRRYDMGITVANLGSGAQLPSLLMSVAVYQNGTKVNQIGVPPLRPGARTTVHYVFERSAEAHDNTTRYRLQLMENDPHGHPVTDCNTANDSYRLTL